MDDIFWLLMLFPLIWPLVAKRLWGNDITWAEMALNMVLVVVLSGGIWYSGKYSSLADTEVWSGEVTGKKRTVVSCEHSYQCHCRSVSCGKGCTTQVCDTCYEHSYDIDWRVHTNVGDLNINRVDRQGLSTPARWAAVKIGEPASIEKPFINYVKASAHTLFAETDSLIKEFEKQIPNYPRVLDYYRINRVQEIGVNIPDLSTWNWRLSELMKNLGPNKQVNVHILMVNNPNPNFINGVRAAWQGFKKNDIVIAIGMTNYPKIDWVGVESWSKEDLVNVRLRDSIKELGEVDLEKVLGVIQAEVTAHFVRQPMKDFEYLENEIDPPLWAIILALIAVFIGSPALTWYFSRPGVDLRFPFEKHSFRRYR